MKEVVYTDVLPKDVMLIFEDALYIGVGSEGDDPDGLCPQERE